MITSPASESIQSSKAEPVSLIHNARAKSQALEQEWLATTVQSGSLLSIDCEASPTICTDYDIKSQPILKLFKHGEPLVEYFGPKRASA